MAKTRAEVEGRNVVLTVDENPVMHLKVRRKGAGKISTGVHDPYGGDFLFDEGETFSVRRDVAVGLLELDYVDEIPDPAAEAAPAEAAKAAKA